jgi:hypothetical protein
MKVLQDGTLLAYIEGFYQSDTDVQRALYGAYIVGYLEAVFGMYLRPEEHEEEAKEGYCLNKEKEIVDTQEKQKTESNSGVVYCKDCKFGTFNGNQRVCTRLIDLDADTLIIDKNDYCSHGERKEE